jgi:hypothetical protein
MPAVAVTTVAPTDDSLGSRIASACTCGHIAEAHEHYRRGSDCAICGERTCGAYVAATSVQPEPDRTADAG